MPNRQTEGLEVVRFGEFELIPASGELWRDGSRIPLQDQPIRVLIALLAEAGSLVTRERLREELWPGGVYVDFEHGLNTAVRRLREALGDNADAPRFIETLPRRGYRFIAPVSATTAPRQKTRPRIWRSPGAAAVVALCGLAVAALVLWLRPPAVPHVTSIRQVTHDGTAKFYVYTDGMRIYYSALSGSSVKLMQAPVTGGDSVPLETSLRRPFIHDILPARNELLVEDDVGWAAPDPLWLLSTAGGSARPLGDIEANDAAWSADGQQVVYTKGRDIYAARGDGSGSRRLLTAPATSVRHPRLSTDGQHLRYTLVDMTTLSLWEAAGDGSGAHALLPGWNAGYGRWTPDGGYYVFAAYRDGANT